MLRHRKIFNFIEFSACKKAFVVDFLVSWLIFPIEIHWKTLERCCWLYFPLWVGCWLEKGWNHRHEKNWTFLMKKINFKIWIFYWQNSISWNFFLISTKQTHFQLSTTTCCSFHLIYFLTFLASASLSNFLVENLKVVAKLMVKISKVHLISLELRMQLV